jgi:Protein of unknown function (DUF3276)
LQRQSPLRTIGLKRFFQTKRKTIVDNERNSKHFESVYSTKVRAGKRRTYFFDVRRTKGEDYYLTLTESSRRMDGGYDRHKIFLYKEDLNRFVATLEETVNYIKTELMPQYDYDEFTRRQEEYEARMLEEREQNAAEKAANPEESDEAAAPAPIELKAPVEIVRAPLPPTPQPPQPPVVELKIEVPKPPPPIDDDEDMAW